MQSILITLATAVILAIVAAFAAPFVVDWNAWRSTFESEASRTLGVPVVIRGKIDASLLPTPRLVLRMVSVGADSVSTGATAEALQANFALGALLRGDLEARDITIVRPQVRLVLDSTGRISLPIGTGRAAGLSADRLTIQDGTLDILDRGADRVFRFTALDLRGEARSFTGPFRLEGEARLGAHRYAVRANLGQMGADGAKLRLMAEERERPLALDLDGTLRLDGGTPRFDGRGLLTRKGTASAGQEAGDGWRLTGTLRASPEAVVSETLEMTLGDEARPTQLTGSARLSLGRALGLDAVLNARSLDADLLRPAGATGARTPLEAVAGLVGIFAGLPAPDLPTRIGAGVDQLTVGGTVVRDARLDLVGGADGWRISLAEAKLPGQSDVRLSGVPVSAGGAGAGSGFAGDLAFSSEQPAVFLRWAAPRAPPEYAAAVKGPAKVAGKLAVHDGAFALSGLDLTLGTARASGAGALTLGTPGRLDLALSLDGFDLDLLIPALRQGWAVAGGGLEGAIALDGRNLTVSGLSLRAASVVAEGKAAAGAGAGAPPAWTVSRLVLDDLAGLRLEGSARFARLDPLVGSLDLAIAGTRADGLVPIARLVAGPQTSDAIRRLLPVAAPVRLATVASWGEGGARTMRAEGTLGLLSGRAIFERADPGLPDRVELALGASDAARVLEEVGIGGLRPGQGPGRIDLSLRPGAGSDAAFQGQLTLADASASGTGTVRLGADGMLQPAVDMRFESADLSKVLVAASAMETGPVPAALTFRLARDGTTWTLDRLTGTLAGAPVSGTVGLEGGAVPRLTGRLDLDAVSLPRLIGLWGARSTGAEVGGGPWSAARFAPAAVLPIAAMLDLKAQRIDLGGTYVLTGGRMRLHAEGATLDIRDLSGALGGGQMSGSVLLRRRPETVAVEGHLVLDNVPSAVLLAGYEGRSAPRGRVSLVADLLGSGRSPVQVIQGLTGQGTLTLRDLEIPAADPRAIETVMAETVIGTPPDERRTAVLLDRALARGPLKLDVLESTFGVVNGVARLSLARALSGPVRATLTGTLDLNRIAFEAGLDLEQAEASGASAGGTVLWRGPLASPDRRVTAAPLTAVIAMRAIERETRRLEERQGFVPAAPQSAPPASATPPVPAPATPPAAAPISAPVAVPPPVTTAPVQRAPQPPRQVAAPPLAPPLEIGPGTRPARPQDVEIQRLPASPGFGNVPRPPGLMPLE